MRDPLTTPTISVQAEAPEATSIKNLALNTMKNVERLKEEARVAKEMVEEELSSDPQYSRLDSEIESMQKERAQVKKMLMSTERVGSLADKAKEVKEELKEAKKDLSDYLVAYKNQTKQLSFFDESGNVVLIKEFATAKYGNKNK